MHEPVLAGPALEWLRVLPHGVYVDCTAGAGGHSARIAERLTDGGRLIAIDRDPRAVELSRARLASYPWASVHRANYGDLGRVLSELNIDAIDGILLDAGLSSMQIDDPSRGFSFQSAGPLDMRMNPDDARSAAGLLDSISIDELVDILRRYGDVKRVRRIAEAILRRRDAGTLNTTTDLADAVAESLGVKSGYPDDVRRVFQAIRIVVNLEFESIEAVLDTGIEALRSGGRFVAITFHSGEDRIVKEAFRSRSRAQRELAPDGRIAGESPAVLKLLTPKPIRPDAAELAANSRAASGRLRAAEKR